MDAVTNLFDKVASLVPSVIPARAAEATIRPEFCVYSSCNDGDFFVSLLRVICTPGCRSDGCC
jgi:hypothetical protein